MMFYIWHNYCMEKKTRILQSLAKIALQSPAPPCAGLENLQNEFGQDLERLTGGQAIILAMVGKAIGGDVAAASWLRDTAGERPVESSQISLLDGLTIRLGAPKEEVQEVKIDDKPLISNKIK